MAESEKESALGMQAEHRRGWGEGASGWTVGGRAGTAWVCCLTMAATDRLRLVSVGIRGVRTLADVELDLGPMTVLIGTNGSGKSTILECLELLRRTPGSGFLEDFHVVHGGAPRLLRHGAQRIELRARLEDPAGGARYSYRIAVLAGRIHVESLEIRENGGAPRKLFDRDAGGRIQLQTGSGELSDAPSLVNDRTILAQTQWNADPGIAQVAAALAGIDVHVGFDVLVPWVATGQHARISARSPVIVRPADRVGLLGSNLPNVFQALRNRGDDAWQDTMSLVRLGLGDWVDSVVLTPTADGGSIALAIKARGMDGTIPAVSLSDGQLAYLAFVALVKSSADRTLLAIDEPELHLHPEMAARVFDSLVGLSRTTPVVIATHSRRLLDQLEDPAAATVVCSVEPGFPQTTVLRTKDQRALERGFSEDRPRPANV